MSTILALQVVAVIGIALVGFLIRYYASPYAAEKGKNHATKEDVAEITHRIESVKAEYASNLMSLRAALGSLPGIHQFRYQREYDLLLQLSEKVVQLRDANFTLRPETEYVNPEEYDVERKSRKLQRYTTASRDLYQFYEARQPFFAESLLGALRALDQVAWHDVVQYWHRSPQGEGFDPNYWENAAENAAKIQAATDLVLVSIRARVQLWEKFDPGP